jgi:hypothetical protein
MLLFLVNQQTDKLRHTKAHGHDLRCLLLLQAEYLAGAMATVKFHEVNEYAKSIFNNIYNYSVEQKATNNLGN